VIDTDAHDVMLSWSHRWQVRRYMCKAAVNADCTITLAVSTALSRSYSCT
jgi:hypothetical protein